MGVIARLGRSIRARLALFASIAMALLCLTTSSALLWMIYTTTVDIHTQDAVGTTLTVAHLVKESELPLLDSLDVWGVQVVDPRGQVVTATSDLAGSPRLTTAAPPPGATDHVAHACDLPGLSDGCHITSIFRVYQQDGDWLVYAFRPRPPWYAAPGVIAFLVLASAALVVLTWYGVSHVVAKTLAPVNRITGRLAEITAGGGGMRVPVPENADEIRALAETANRTLAQLEEAMEQQRRFSSDASHDLRSPITAMRTEVEEALLTPGETDWQKVGGKLLGSLDRLQNIVTDLLTLAKLDAGAPARLGPVDLGELVTAEVARPCTKEVRVSVQPGVVVTGDRLRLARLLSNLLDNAERHAERTIAVIVRRNGEAVLEVLDDGAGIAPEHREMVFSRFTRLDASRSRDAGGTGLGLPIAREIARTHGGTLRIEDSDAGARFVLRIPVRTE
ncbi:HAMP domain-containing histidine kinase [Nonomuraea longispora]|uniref:histidine kinase n=1 Tax=Nonomuraea longispora TaxID=1848320 RepID=A0A4R4N0M6_9ACTN|nr:HAMP domain-containing histidine kinase [Nonomuraea longispora]